MSDKFQNFFVCLPPGNLLGSSSRCTGNFHHFGFSHRLCVQLASFSPILNAEDPLVVAKIIGDVVDPFLPSVNMSVNYGSKHVSDGMELKPSMTGNRPTVHIGGHEKDMHTLVFTDPDVPGPDNPFDREFLHWVVVNIPGGTEACHGEEVVSYVRPTPPIGIHRYVFVLFKQKGKFLPKAVAAPERVKFKTRYFADKHELGLPGAVEYFTAQKESQ